jgi:hypothetical protein
MSFTDTRHITKTRKPHSCCWCGEAIPQGSSAVYTAGHNNGDFYAGHWHDECHTAYNRMSNEEYDDVQDGWMEGDFQRGKTPRESWGER